MKYKIIYHHGDGTNHDKDMDYKVYAFNNHTVWFCRKD